MTQVPEKEAVGDNVDSDEARAIAESAASGEPWLITDIGAKESGKTFELIESSDTVKLGGRVDHTFVYERVHERIFRDQKKLKEDDGGDKNAKKTKLEDARYRIRLSVAGNQLIGLEHYVKIPEDFTRQYTAMRSANVAVSQLSFTGLSILYGVAGVIGGIALLLRRKALVTRPAIISGVFLSAMVSAAMVCKFPLEWMTYDTALSLDVFYTQFVIILVANFVFLALVAGTSVAAAEGLGRYVDASGYFGHFQFFSLLHPGGADVWEQVLVAYALVPVMFAYEVTFYFTMVRGFGWWTPSSPLVDPDTAAHVLPSVGAIGQSLFAGFWEECLFRAVPIAGGVLLGEWMGKCKTTSAKLLVPVFLVQAVVFGGAHANYPAQPSYARLVELILPSIAFGLLYVRWGLLPGILMHFLYDLVWFALPIFLSPPTAMLTDKLIVLVAALIPGIFAIYRHFAKGPSTPPDQLTNQHWFQKPKDKNSTQSDKEPKSSGKAAAASAIEIPLKGPAPRALRSLLSRIAPVLFGAWLLVALPRGKTPWHHAISRSEALDDAKTALESAYSAAREALAEDSPRNYSTVAVFKSGLSEEERMQHSFVWHTAGSATYTKLLNIGFLGRPHWAVRFAQFNDGDRAEGDEAAYAEEWQANVYSDSFVGVVHKVPEAFHGTNITEESAREAAERFLHINHMIHLAYGPKWKKWNEKGASESGGGVHGCHYVREVSAKPIQLSQRLDWTLVYTCADQVRKKYDCTYMLLHTCGCRTGVFLL